jgi:predicted metal-dependent hydrolase
MARANSNHDLPASTLTLARRKVPVRVRQSSRAQRIALRIDAADAAVELVLPRRVKITTGLNFLESRRDWVEARIALVPEHTPFKHDEEIPLFGVPHRINHLGERRRGLRGFEDGHVVTIRNGEIRVVGAAAHVQRRVRDHLLAFAKQELSRRAHALAAKVNRRINRITVRDTKSRWGSCSATGNLSFSWRLILAPKAVFHYVVAHEVAHLVEMNHGPRFWRLVDQLAPNSERHKIWLKRNRTRLLRYG